MRGPRGSHPLEKFIGVAEGPVGVVRYCRACGKFRVMVKKGIRGAGRGYGFVAGSKARGELIQHVKTCPAVAAAIAKESKA